MIYKVVIERPAESDLDEGFVRYERIRQGLGEVFLLCVEEVLGHASRNPQIYPTVLDNIHRAVTRRFPYLVLYVIEGHALYVLAVFPGQRSSRHIKRVLKTRTQARRKG